MFSSIGGKLCLDFINTVAHRLRPVSDESLFGYDDLVSWALALRAVRNDEAQVLRQQAVHSPHEADAAFRQALVVRESAFAVFSSLIEGKSPPDSAMKMIQDWFCQERSRMSLVEDAGVFRWKTAEAALRLSYPAGTVAQSVVELLTSGEYRNVKRCDGIHDCGYLFFDASKNGTRRWCSMDSCGSRAKMRTLYARRHEKPVS